MEWERNANTRYMIPTPLNAAGHGKGRVGITPQIRLRGFKASAKMTKSAADAPRQCNEKARRFGLLSGLLGISALGTTVSGARNPTDGCMTYRLRRSLLSCRASSSTIILVKQWNRNGLTHTRHSGRCSSTTSSPTLERKRNGIPRASRTSAT